MRSLKVLSVAALATLITMMFFGTSSAMAENTVLCAADEETCKEKSLIMHVHETTLAGSPATLLNSLGNVTCDVLFLSTSVGSPGAPQIIKGNFTYSNCLRSASESCTVTEKNGPTEIKVLKEGHETGKVTGKGEVQVKCGSFINCTYDGEGLEASAKGSLLSTETNGSVSLNEQVTHKVSGFICPGEAKLDITTTPLVAIYIRAGELGEKMVCIFVGTNNGFYLNASGTTCETQNKTRVGSYELAFATTGTAKTHVCAFVANGFYLSANNGGTCEAQDETRVGSYELGITQ